MSKQAETLSSAATAYLRGQQEGGDSLFWLQRAHRLAPNDPRILLDLARKELTLPDADRQATYKKFKTLTQNYDLAPAWVGLAIAAQLCRNATAAAKALEALLTRHCLPDDSYFAEFASHIAHIAGYDGWQGVRADGTMVQEGEGRLLGVETNFAALNQIYGVLTCKGQGLTGWAVRPAWPDQAPTLTLTDAKGQSRIIQCGRSLVPDETAPFFPRYRFRLTPKQLAGMQPPFQVTGADGKPLWGSPLDPAALNHPPQEAAFRGPAVTQIPPRAKLALIMPVYKGLEETRAAVQSVLRSKAPDTRFIVVNDASPDEALVAWLHQQGAEQAFELLQHPKNLGFCASINTGLETAKGCDVVLLNSDILVSRMALQTMQELAYTHPQIGTITPFSNEATICSYPDPQAANPMPDMATTDQLDEWARATNGLAFVEIPTGVGFCLYIRHDCLQKTGRLRGEIFAQGYGEENDFCLRARHLGYQNVLAVGAYVAHCGHVSFKNAAIALGQRNTALIERLFPGYQALVQAYHKADPAAPYRQALDEVRLCHQLGNRPAVLLISHAHGGGVAKQIEATCAAYEAQGMVPLMLTTRPPKSKWVKYPWPSQLKIVGKPDYPNFTFTLPEALPALLSLLKKLHVEKIEMHHTLGHHPIVRELAGRLGVAQEIVAHDYASFCPRVNLITRSNKNEPYRYCGEPDLSGCITCYRQNQAGRFETLSVPQLLARSQAEFAAAAKVVVPSGDMARRLMQHFPGLKPEITPWEDDQQPVTLRPPRYGTRRIGILGGIGPAKGYDVVLDCVRDATSRHLPLEFVIIGNTADDEPFLRESVKVTGGYKHEELPVLVRDLAIDLAFLPSICPETWGFVLSEAWQCGLYTVVFDLGAQAERVRATKRGSVLPLGLPCDRVNNFLINVTY